MKIYKHVFDEYKNTLKVIEVEVEEKPKTYVVVENVDGVYERVISKADIGKLNCSWYPTMYTLTPERNPYINSLIDKNENDIIKLLEKIDALKCQNLKLKAMVDEDDG